MSRALVFLMTLVFVPLGVQAQDADARRVVEVRAAGGASVTSAMQERVRALEARLSVTVRWDNRERIEAREVLAEREPSSDVLARVWLDLSDPARAVLFIGNATSDRFLVRVVPTADGYGELTRESLATIVESVVDALLSGGQIGVDRDAAAHEIEAHAGTPVVTPEPLPPVVEPVTAPPPVAPRPRGRARRVIALRYRVDLVADGPIVRQGPELAFSWTGFFQPTLDLSISVAAHYDPPFTLGDTARGVMLHGGGARVMLGATGRVGRVLVWEAALGGGADMARVEPRFAPETGLASAAPFALVVPVATGALGAAVWPAPWLELELALGIDIDLAGHHFDVQSGSTRSVLMDSWLVHPFGFLGVGVPLEV